MVCFFKILLTTTHSTILVEPGLSWPLYLAACCCGATIVAFLAWYTLENELVMKRVKKFFLKEEESERSALSKITTNVLSTIVYVINRIIKTTAHILVSPVRIFLIDANFKKCFAFREVRCLPSRRRHLGGKSINVFNICMYLFINEIIHWELFVQIIYFVRNIIWIVFSTRDHRNSRHLAIANRT